MKYVDTNVFIRYMTGDDPVKAAAAERFLAEVDAGREEVTITESILTEIAYVLSGRGQYGMSNREVARRIRAVLQFRGLHLAAKQTYMRALDLYEANAFLDIEDAICVAHMEAHSVTEIVSFDRDFDRVSSVIRLEP
jgi:predicted nucleic acid-binding protein